ncbi:hypothetical protein GCM10007301_10190 [Azorhizobium oxalatiphilum]|uniref:Uncharacterized protein n=1 Tax=Azorhizobium oxalatiphilum TaxID=980631 RepID=A0A917BPC9_9HYPH|nr:hypothetical protein GCM10007301_10190 [Azorhizobium oxalatiphilum]
MPPADRPADLLPGDFTAAVARLEAHPQFRSVLSRYCHTVAAQAPEGWPLVKLLDQLARYMICYVMIHNYHAWRQGSGPPPTLSALQGAVQSSARQTAGFVAQLKASRLVMVEPDPADRRVKHLRPTPDVVFEVGRSVLAFVAAAEELSGGATARSALLAAHADALGDLLRRSAAFVLAHGTLIHPFPRVLSFARRDCGYLLLCAVMGAHYAATVPGAAPALPLSYRALAGRLRVSPAHVGNLLRDGEREGWFATDARGRLAFMDPTLSAEFELWGAWQMAHYLALAGETAEAFAPAGVA